VPLFPPDVVLDGHKAEVVKLIGSSNKPAIFSSPDWADSGGLISFGPDLADAGRHQIAQLDRMLKGEKPPTCRSTVPPNFSSASISSPREQWASSYPPRRSPAPTESSNEAAPVKSVNGSRTKCGPIPKCPRQRSSRCAAPSKIPVHSATAPQSNPKYLPIHARYGRFLVRFNWRAKRFSSGALLDKRITRKLISGDAPIVE
jgi:hypothetical protein